MKRRLPKNIRLSTAPASFLVDIVTFLLDSITIGCPVLERILLAIKEFSSIALPSSFSPPEIIRSCPIPCYKTNSTYMLDLITR